MYRAAIALLFSVSVSAHAQPASQPATPFRLTAIRFWDADRLTNRYPSSPEDFTDRVPFGASIGVWAVAAWTPLARADTVPFRCTTAGPAGVSTSTVRLVRRAGDSTAPVVVRYIDYDWTPGVHEVRCLDGDRLLASATVDYHRTEEPPPMQMVRLRFWGAPADDRVIPPESSFTTRIPRRQHAGIAPEFQWERSASARRVRYSCTLRWDGKSRHYRSQLTMPANTTGGGAVLAMLAPSWPATRYEVECESGGHPLGRGSFEIVE